MHIFSISLEIIIVTYTLYRVVLSTGISSCLSIAGLIATENLLTRYAIALLSYLVSLVWLWRRGSSLFINVGIISLSRSIRDSLLVQQCCLIFLSISSELYSFYSAVLISHPNTLLPQTVPLLKTLNCICFDFLRHPIRVERNLEEAQNFLFLFAAGSPAYSISFRTRLVSSLNYTKCVR